MRPARLLLASTAIFVAALIWNGLLHGVIFPDSLAALEGIARPEGPLLAPSLALTAALALVFVWSYARFARRGGWRGGLEHGLFFAVLAGLLVNLNQYALFPIPATASLTWWTFGVAEFCLYGLLASWLYPLDPDPRR